MKTINITIEIIEKNITISETLKDKIESFKKEMAQEKAIQKQRFDMLHDLKNQFKKELNSSFGEEVWQSDYSNYTRCYPVKGVGGKLGVKIEFDDLVRRNSSRKKWELWFTSPYLETRRLSTLNYEPVNQEIIEIILKGEDWETYTIKSIDQIHKIVENDYITYLTNKSKI